jgi:hypothetical protein
MVMSGSLRPLLPKHEGTKYTESYNIQKAANYGTGKVLVYLS